MFANVKKLLVAALPIIAASCSSGTQPVDTSATPDGTKTRVVVLSDAEIDDQCSMTRFLLYANEFDVEGIVTTSSRFHWHGHAWAGDDWMDDYLRTYREVYPNLCLHGDYPTPDYIESVTVLGNCEGLGEMEEVTPGSELIVKLLLDESDQRPIWFQAWGGTNTLARALKTIEEDHPEKMDSVAKKLRLFLIWEQDNTYTDYIRPVWGKYNFLTVFSDQFWALAYGWRETIPEQFRDKFQPDFILSNIMENHGPFCANYRARGGNFPSEGDSPSFLYCISTGLNDLEHPDWGSWGGRYDWGRENSYFDPNPTDDGWVIGDASYNPGAAWLGQHKDATAEQRDAYYWPLTRWSGDMQDDFAARADWCVMSYEEANHQPKVMLSTAKELTAEAGKTVKLDVSKSSDPDGDTLSFNWWEYTQADSFAGEVEIANASSAKASFTVPSDAKSGDTIHLVCTVRDSGTPTLTRYARVIVTVK